MILNYFFMKHPFFSFGEKVHDYDIPVFNEREVRAAAGIMFLGAMIAFMNAFLIQNFDLLKVFVVIFFLDFTLRMFVNPRYAPSMILGRIFIHNQKPEYAGAPQKKFAWWIGWVMAFVMTWVVVVFEIRWTFNLIMCTMCLIFLFCESVFGICIGCKMYEFFTHKKAKLCPGGVCEFQHKHDIQKIHSSQIIALISFAILILGISFIIL